MGEKIGSLGEFLAFRDLNLKLPPVDNQTMRKSMRSRGNDREQADDSRCTPLCCEEQVRPSIVIERSKPDVSSSCSQPQVCGVQTAAKSWLASIGSEKGHVLNAIGAFACTPFLSLSYLFSVLLVLSHLLSLSRALSLSSSFSPSSSSPSPSDSPKRTERHVNNVLETRWRVAGGARSAEMKNDETRRPRISAHQFRRFKS